MHQCKQERRLTTVEAKVTTLEGLVVPIQKDIRTIKYLGFVLLGVVVGAVAIIMITAKQGDLVKLVELILKVVV
jgi:hypothetical protein